MFVLGQTHFNQLAAQPAKPGPLIGYELVDTSGVFPLLQFVIFFSALAQQLQCFNFVRKFEFLCAEHRNSAGRSRVLLQAHP